MKKNRHIFYLLFTISIVMLIMPVLPHHHHGNEIICMKNDLSKCECPADHHQHHSHDDACCKDKCITHIQTLVPAQQGDEIQPQQIFIFTLFTEPLLSLLAQSEAVPDRNSYIYFESLHSTAISGATPLRAPPCILS